MARPKREGGVRGFSWKPRVDPPSPPPSVPDLGDLTEPVPFLDEVPCQQLLEGIDLAQAQQLYNSLTEEQKEQLAAQGLDPRGCFEATSLETDLDKGPPRYVEFTGNPLAMDSRQVRALSKALCGKAPMKFMTDAYSRVRHSDPESPIHVLSECGDSRCGAHRLHHPEVRSRFRTFLTKTVRKSSKDASAWWRDGLMYASLGSGHLLWDCEILDRMRAEGLEIRQICLIDMAYAKPDDITLLVLQTFADWQAAVADLWDEPAPQVLAFGSSQAYFEHCGPGGVAAGCNLFMHCDAAWQGSDEECMRLAQKALVSTGLLARLNNLGSKIVPDEMLQKGPQMLRKYWQVQQEHSEEPFSAGAWLSHGDGDLEPLKDYWLGLDPDEKAMQHLETDHRFKQAERARAEEIGLEVWRVRSLDPVKSREAPVIDGREFGEFSPGEVLIAAERKGDWIRVAATLDLWGVEYSAWAKLSVAAPLAHAQPGQSMPPPADDSSVWVPIDGSCIGSIGRFLEQIFVPPGRDPWRPGGPSVSSADSLAVEKGDVTLRARRRGLDLDWTTSLARAASTVPPGSVRRRQKERGRWRAVLHEANGGQQHRRAVLASLEAEERAHLRTFVKRQLQRYQALANELSRLRGFARKERLAKLSVEDRANFQSWLLEQKAGLPAKTSTR